MKRIFKRSASSDLRGGEIASNRSNMDDDTDPQDTAQGTLERQLSREGREIVKEGWGEKESGQKIFGHYNWRRRLFRLTAKGHIVIFSYYVKPTDTNAKGEVMLTQEYNARELEMGEKSKPNCFALGPLSDSSALRTYYISCYSEDDKIDWITTLNCVIEGVPGKILKRKTTYRARGSQMRTNRMTYPPPELNSKGDTFSYQKFKWRIDQWYRLCREVKEGQWKRFDTKNGIKIARQSFKDTDLAVIMVESTFNVPKKVFYEYLQRSLRSGGKFDFIFRGETVIQKIEEYQTSTEVIKNEYDVPLPGMKRRDVCLAKLWIPDYITRDGSSGLLVISVQHPSCKVTKEMERAFLDVSGMILYDEEGPNGEMNTRAVVLVQMDLKNALQNMLRGAFKSDFRLSINLFEKEFIFEFLRFLTPLEEALPVGVLKRGIRNGINYLRNCLAAYKEMMMI